MYPPRLFANMPLATRPAPCCRALTDEYLAILEVKGGEAQQVAGRSLSEQQYQQWWREQQQQQIAAAGAAAAAGEAAEAAAAETGAAGAAIAC